MRFKGEIVMICFLIFHIRVVHTYSWISMRLRSKLKEAIAYQQVYLESMKFKKPNFILIFTACRTFLTILYVLYANNKTQTKGKLYNRAVHSAIQ